jgi:hypothetical protein
MRAPITVNYTPDGDDWTVTVIVAGEPTARRAKAVGLIAARDQADQMVAQIAPNEDGRRVVHLLEGDAYAFTDSYLKARLGLKAEKSTDQVIRDGAPTSPSWPGAVVAGAETAVDMDNQR